MRLLWKLLPGHLLIALFVMLATAWGGAHALRVFHYHWTESALESAARLVCRQVEEALPDLPPARLDALCKALEPASGYRLTVIRPDGVVIGDSEAMPEDMDNHTNRPEIRTALGGVMGSAIRYSRTVRRQMVYVAVPLRHDGRVAAVVRASLPMLTVEHALQGLRHQILGLGLLVVLAAGVFSYVVSRRVSRPLAELRAGALAFGAGDLSRRLPPCGIAELDLLADMMNRMAAQLSARLEALARQRDEQNTLFACMTEGVLAVDAERHLIKMNRAGAAMFEVPDGVPLGGNVMEVIRNADLHTVIERTLASPEPVEGEIYLPDANLYLQAHGARLRRPDGGNGGGVIVLADITRLRRLEAMRRDFVANVSHELKTPVTSIKGFAETLLDDDAVSDADRGRFLKVINKQADRLGAILDDLLTLFAIEHGADTGAIEFQDGNLSRVIDSVARALQPAAEAKGMRLDVRAPEELHGRFNVQLVEQAVTDLVDNAVKYSAPGTAVEIVGAETERELAVHVSDQGPGIPAVHLPRIFERFYRVDKSRSRKLGGTGLGLAIVKHIALAHHGRVDVKSEPGRGSTFSLFLPKHPPRHQA